MAALARFSRVFGLKGAEINLIRGAVHCTAVAWDGESGWTLRVCEVSPASLGEDPFVLQFCRASADALLQTGTNMRAEPGFWPAWTRAAFSDALDAHRAELGKRPGPLPVVLLTRGAQHSRPSQFLAEWGNDIAVSRCDALSPPGHGVTPSPTPRPVRRCVARLAWARRCARPCPERWGGRLCTLSVAWSSRTWAQPTP